MQIDAMYDSGRLILPSIQLKHSRFQVRAIVPDEEVIDLEKDQQVQGTQAGSSYAVAPLIAAEVQDILGPWREKLKDTPLLTKSEMRDFRCKEWEEKHSGSA